LIRFQADADIRQQIVLAVRRLEHSIDFASAADSKLIGTADPHILDFAAREGRVLVTHDRRTMIEHFRNHLEQAKLSPGVFLVSQFAATNAVAEALVMVWSASEITDWENQLRHLPSLSRHVFSR